ncbi:DUF4345 domain-containing protein [Parasphingopyxis lamellibrachiae]|uniref:Uncharacterized protein DUF4345 n=1 Tax=Parasphingopyxis lamellibrachiae TaxID=680125 RepID=A0A3D9FGW9_9SPHN|nr:DUF4345 domain-containing protein [Parasphingopyxis lamellibrachiae]RED16817.1 uncharacterized protein DUF4345 [Parasphingopyxis lamellibrachiae]
MTPDVEKRLLQGATAIACLVPLSMGAASIVIGPSVLSGIDDPPIRDLDSHFRYLSGIFFMLGIAFASCVPGIETKTARFRLLGAMVVMGGLARLWSAAEYGLPSEGHRFGFAMELGVVPLLMLWQARVARRFARPAGSA